MNAASVATANDSRKRLFRASFPCDQAPAAVILSEATNLSAPLRAGRFCGATRNLLFSWMPQAPSLRLSYPSFRGVCDEGSLRLSVHGGFKVSP
jgi:hypothetical protein